MKEKFGGTRDKQLRAERGGVDLGTIPSFLQPRAVVIVQHVPFDSTLG